MNFDIHFSLDNNMDDIVKKSIQRQERDIKLVDEQVDKVRREFMSLHKDYEKTKKLSTLEHLHEINSHLKTLRLDAMSKRLTWLTSVKDYEITKLTDELNTVKAKLEEYTNK